MDLRLGVYCAKNNLVSLSELDIVLPQVKWSCVTLFTLIEPLGVGSSPVFRKIAKLFKYLLNAIDELVLELKSNTDSFSVPSKTKTSLLIRVDDYREEVVHFELVEVNSERGEEHVIQIEVRLNLSLCLEVRNPLQLIVVVDRVLSN